MTFVLRGQIASALETGLAFFAAKGWVDGRPA